MKPVLAAVILAAMAMAQPARAQMPDPVRFGVRMEAGDIALLYTDGLTEAMNPKGVEYGLPRAMTALNEMRELPAAEICKMLIERVRDFRKVQTHFEDDVTVAVIRKVA